MTQVLYDVIVAAATAVNSKNWGNCTKNVVVLQLFRFSLRLIERTHVVFYKLQASKQTKRTQNRIEQNEKTDDNGHAAGMLRRRHAGTAD